MYTLKKYKGNSTNIVIPTTINNKAVAIADLDKNVFPNASSITSIKTDKESDLIENDSKVTGTANVKIRNTMSQPIITSQNKNHNAVYDYHLGKVSLVLENVDIVPSGSYQGKVEWNLSNVCL